MTVEPIAELRTALEAAVAELAFEAGWQADTNPERAEHLMSVATRVESVLQRTDVAQP